MLPVPGLALGPHHRRALVDPAQRLAEVPAAAHERDLEGVLVDVVVLVGRGEHLGLVDVVDAERLEDLGLDEVADARLGHDRDGHRVHDPLDHRGVGHAGDAAGLADVGRDALERHDGDGAGILGDLGLIGRDDVHDDAALEHLGKTLLGGPGGRLDGHVGWILWWFALGRRSGLAPGSSPVRVDRFPARVPIMSRGFATSHPLVQTNGPSAHQGGVAGGWRAGGGERRRVARQICCLFICHEQDHPLCRIRPDPEARPRVARAWLSAIRS